MDNAVFSPWLARWKLLPDGAATTTHTSQLLPVTVAASGAKAMLKITHDVDEQRGNRLMAWWQGEGAAAVIAQHNEAILLARAGDSSSLTVLSQRGRDDEACRILCRTANRLHASTARPLPQLTPLDVWFSPLMPAAQKYGGFLTRSAEFAQSLLSTPRDVVALHGDLHHDNVLDFGASGWLAIDPKALIGERGFDFANIFTNPDLGYPEPRVAVVAEIFKQRLATVSEAASLDKTRLLQWIVAWCGLSATWLLEDNEPTATVSAVAKLALAELEG
ncbi:aminoglycoside phosphotransferase family protein [Kluyvera sp. STS39-E]|uniref:aminoglycoside phosphotransferase family protein n=1 Tax=Kluyvera sp. STS39-E TaxID=3234748 RepID=UPI0034C660B5